MEFGEIALQKSDFFEKKNHVVFINHFISYKTLSETQKNHIFSGRSFLYTNAVFTRVLTSECHNFHKKKKTSFYLNSDLCNKIRQKLFLKILVLKNKYPYDHSNIFVTIIFFTLNERKHINLYLNFLHKI